MIKELIYLPLDIPNPPNVSCFFDTVLQSDMILDNYRTCSHIPIMSPTGELTNIGKQVPELITWLYDHIIPWTAPTRIRILVTDANKSNAPHIDCSPAKFKTLQHKFRYVFQGKRPSLYFLNNNKKEVIPDVDKPYIMDGSWPHEMINDCNERKYTLVLGAPWEPTEDDVNYNEVLNRSFEMYKQYYISSSTWQLPKNYKSLFEDKYINELSTLN